MRALEASELLQVWERGVGRAPARAIMPLLMTACPEIDPQRLLHLTIGERDALLLSQREWMFGPQLEATASCPTCAERLEFSVTVDDLRAVPPVTDASDLGYTISGSAAVDAYQVEFRAPTIADTQRTTTLQELLERCLIQATRAGEIQAVGELPPAVIEAISRHLAAADPQANIELALNCPSCGQEWSATFDITAFLWQELHTWAQRTLLEIHQLAGAYGWSEAEILALSPARRQVYLTIIGAGE